MGTNFTNSQKMGEMVTAADHFFITEETKNDAVIAPATLESDSEATEEPLVSTPAEFAAQAVMQHLESNANATINAVERGRKQLERIGIRYCK